MITYKRKAGTTDVSVVLRIIDSTDGTPETGVVYNTSGIDLEYRREGATSTDITEATLSALSDAHADGGFLHIGNGYYRLDLPDAACAAGATGVLVHGTVTGMVVIGCYVQLVSYDPFDSVRLGLTALPNAAADSAGGLPISDAGGLDLDVQLVTKLNKIPLSDGTTTFNATCSGDIKSGLSTQAELDKVPKSDGTTSWNATARAAINAEADTAIADAALATAANLATVAGYIDTEIATIITTLGAAGAGLTAVTDRLPAALVGGRMDANVGAISADATAADNLEAQFDGTGYLHPTGPAYQAQISAISGGLAIQETVDTSTVIQGSVAGTVGNMDTHDGAYYTVTDTGSGIDFILKVSPTDTGSHPVECHMHGYYDENAGAANSVAVQAYNFTLAAWETVQTLTNAAAIQSFDIPLVTAHQSPGTVTVNTVDCVAGDVLVRFLEGATESGSDMFIDHLTVGFAGSPVTAAEVWAAATRTLTALDEDDTAIDLNTTAIGSVAGAVGSVTGNVGGNVVGTVAGVTPAATADVLAQVQAALDEAFSDATVLTLNGLKDRLRKLGWRAHNLFTVDEATGDYVLKKDNGTTTAATGTVTSAAGVTTRSAPTWA